MRIKKKHSGMERYMRRVSAALRCRRKEKRAALQEIQTMLLEIPHAETMAYAILVAAAGEPEKMAAAYGGNVLPRMRKTEDLRPCIAATVFCAALVCVFLLGLACGLERSGKMQGFDFDSGWAKGVKVDGYVQSYKMEDGSLQAWMLEMPEEEFQKLPEQALRRWAKKRA